MTATSKSKLSIGDAFSRVAFWQLMAFVFLGCRITSYNVCYTKLLRIPPDRRNVLDKLKGIGAVPNIVDERSNNSTTQTKSYNFV